MASPLSIELRRFPGIRSLAADYVDTFEPLAPFFAGNPAVPEAWAAAVARAQEHPRPRTEISSLLVRQQERRGAPRAAVAAAEQLSDPRAVAVVTGQQAGLFGGPLFTLLKALTAIRLAERLARERQVPAVPVFWVDAEDHDWEEVRTCTVLDDDLQRRTIALGTPEGAGERPVASIGLDGSASSAVDALADALPRTEFTAPLVAGARKAYAAGTSMAEAFARWLDFVLGDHGLVVYDASDPAFKPLVADLFVRELERPGETARLAAAVGQQLVACGYHAQVGANESSVALFDLDGGRRPIRVHQGQMVIGDMAVDRDVLVTRARHRPESLSPNVLLRPVVQDAIFPTAAYVSGPNELAYLAQLKPVYARFGVPMPLIHPRATATLVDAAAMRFLDRYPVAFESLQPDDEALINRLLESTLPPSVERAHRDASASIEERMTALIEALAAVDPTLQGTARSALGRMQHDLQTLHAKIIHAAKRRHDVLRRQFQRTRALTFPGGAPQERSVGFVYFLNRYGPALVPRLVEALPLEPRRHWVLTI